MDAIEAIRTRRMKPRVTDERPSKADVEELLELATRAPVHHLTTPWRFHVLAGEGRELLAKAIAADAGGVDEHLDAGKAKVERAPVILVVTCVPDRSEKVEEREEFASVAMAVENILLAAHAKGLGAMLRTGSVAYGPHCREHLGLGDDEHVVATIYLGVPAADRNLTPRTPAAEVTRWVGWE